MIYASPPIVNNGNKVNVYSVMDYQRIFSQDNLQYIYESAKNRMASHADYAAKQIKIVDKYPYFKTEKEALEFAIKQIKEQNSDYQIWAKLEKQNDGFFRFQNWWIATDDREVIYAAEYIGLVQVYWLQRLLEIINLNTDINDVAKYY